MRNFAPDGGRRTAIASPRGAACSVFLLLALVAAAIPAAGQASSTPAEHHDLSPPLSLLPPVPPSGAAPAVRRLPRPVTPWGQFDPVMQSAAPAPLIPATTSNFDGIGNGVAGFVVGAAPPDTNGDVGPIHYVQTVNTALAVYNKVTGALLFGPVAINTLWQGFGGHCQTDNDGDPMAIYDAIADRWVIAQFANASSTTGPFFYCVAVSQTSNPMGAYYRYSFSYSNFPDYPKLAVWPDAYYATFNMFNGTGTVFLGAKVCAYDRTRMLSGLPATQQCIDPGPSFGGLLASDLDGAQLPPAGAPNYLVALGTSANQLAVWNFHVDWTTPANSALTGPSILATAAYTEACGGGVCVPQFGTTTRLDSLGDRLMHRLAYRNLGSYEALVVNHSVTAGTSVGVRWYELRVNAGALTIFQQGTYAPDSTYRWMGSIAMDHAGNIGLGFSASSGTIRPEIRYTGRLAGDPAGQMSQGEGTIISGAGSQTGGLTRWGDYSAMSVDPVDDCTFYYTNEYIPTNGSFNWRTRIGSFRFPSCSGGPTPIPTATPTATATPGQASPTPTRAATSTPTYSATVTPSGSPTSLPTATPSGSTCTTFATGVCCDSADGTNCAAPLVVCTTNTTCAGLAPYTTCAGAPADGAWAGSTQTTTYPPSFNQCFASDTVVAASRNLNNGKYMVNDGLVRWDTRSLPDTATVTSATLRVYVVARDSIDARAFQGEWYDWGATCDSTDWSATAASSAFTTPIAGLTLNADNDLPLSAVTNINRTGYTALRLHVSGGVPSGLNRVLFADYEHATQPGPRLVVCYTP